MTVVLYTGIDAPKSCPLNTTVLHQPALTVQWLDLSGHPIIKSLTAPKDPVGLVFYSTRGVHALNRTIALKTLTTDNIRPWAVGQRTQEALRRHLPDANIVVPKTQRFTSLVNTLKTTHDLPQTIWSIELVDTPRPLAQHMRGHNDQIIGVPAYTTVPNLKCTSQWAMTQKVEWVILMSPRGAHTFLADCPSNSPFKIAAIGPTTAQSIEAMGFDVQLIAQVPDAKTLISHIAQLAPDV